MDSGSVRIEIMSLTAYRIKSSNFTSGKGMLVGIKVTVSQSFGILVFGKYFFTHL